MKLLKCDKGYFINYKNGTYKFPTVFCIEKNSGKINRHQSNTNNLFDGRYKSWADNAINIDSFELLVALKKFKKE